MKERFSLNHSMFWRKPVEDLHAEIANRPSLKRVLRPTDLVLMGVGAIIGTGVFVLSGVAAGLHAGNALPLSFLIAGVVCLFAALCYAEFSTMIPVAGSAYTYCYTSLGEIWAWIIGWDLVLEYGLAISAVAIGWSGYFCVLAGSLGFVIPASLSHPFGVDGGIVNLPAVIIVLCLTVLLIHGTQKSVRLNAIIVGIKILVILLFIVLGAGAIHPVNWQPFMPPTGWFGVFSGAAIVFFAFIGFDAVVTAAEETEEPQKSMPAGIIGSLVICMILYVIVGIVLTGIIPYTELTAPDAINAPIAFALEKIGYSWGAMLVSVGAICGMTSVLLVMLFGQSRILFAMSRDGLVPGIFSVVNPVTQTPVNVTVFTGIITAVIAGLFPLSIVAELVNMGTLVAFSIVAFGVIVLRWQQPGLKRPFSCPGVPYIPLLCIACCIFLICHLNTLSHQLFLIWLFLGLVVYFLYGVKKSANRQNGNTCLPEPIPCTINPGAPLAPLPEITTRDSRADPAAGTLKTPPVIARDT
ncbi:amino acid permease [Methanoregula sp.]|jgi:basic amino acid/polyamine antiporter, APA family|uniref:amino acid permease n=1 Tax=Methanoregula sp. TaxID=2052170 RepID=UPI003C217D9B